MIPLIMIGSGLVALVAVAGWWWEILLRAEAEAEARYLDDERNDAWDEVAALRSERDAAARKRSDASRKGHARKKERQRALVRTVMHEIAATSGRRA